MVLRSDYSTSVHIFRILGIVKVGRAIQHFGMDAEFWMNLRANYELKKAKREKLKQIQAEVQRPPAA